MSKHTISFADAELAGLAIKTAKNGNPYASGVLILRNENGGFQSSLPLFASARLLERSEYLNSRSTPLNSLAKAASQSAQLLACLAGSRPTSAVTLGALSSDWNQ